MRFRRDLQIRGRLVAVKIAMTMILVGPAYSNQISADQATTPLPVISEFLAQNEGGLQDEDFDSPDWLELHNPGSLPLSLEGYSLTDDLERLRKWRFPEITIPSGSRIVIFASGKDRRDLEGLWHTNFQLDEDGESLALIGRDGKTMVSVWRDYPSQRPNTSYGIDGSGQRGFFARPTPKAVNGRAFQDWVRPVRFGKERGFFNRAMEVALEVPRAAPGTAIYYTLDGTRPTRTDGTLYTQPISISATRTLRAAAYCDEHLPSIVETHTYLYPELDVRSPKLSWTLNEGRQVRPKILEGLQSLPSISVVTGRPTEARREVGGSVEMLFPNGEKGFHVPCGVKEFGGDFTSFDKKNFRLYFRGDYGASKLRFPVFGESDGEFEAAQEFDQLNLRSGSHDMHMRGFYMANRFTDDTMMAMGHLAPHGRFVHLYLNGVYWGQYHLRERWGAGMFAEYFGGKKENYEAINGNRNVGGWARTGTRDAYDGTGRTWMKLQSLARIPNPTNYEAVAPYLDTVQYIDYMLLYFFGNAECEYRCAGVAGPGSGFKFFLNDADGFLGDAFQSNRPRFAFTSSRRGVQGRHFGDGPGSLFSLLYKAGHPDFRMLVADRIHRHFFNDGALTTSQNLKRLDRRLSEVETSMVTEIARWRDSGQTYRSPSEWMAVRDQVKSRWLPGRTEWMVDQFRSAGLYPRMGAPTMRPHGGAVSKGAEVSLTAPDGEIYYTTTGADPRSPGGGLHPDAIPYEDALVREVLVPKGAIWRYRDDGKVPDPNWQALDYQDRHWPRGLGEFGYGDGDEHTVVSYGRSSARKHPATYFRHAFTLTGGVQGVQDVIVQLKRDDGAIVYLNGKVAAESNLKAPVNHRAYAAKAQDDGNAFHTFRVPAAHLRSGKNVIAVEVHQSSGGSSDLSFDLSLAVTRKDSQKASSVLKLTKKNMWVRARARRGSQWSALNEAFFTMQGQAAVSLGALAVSELHYHPAEDQRTEFVELLNRSSHPVNLRACAFTGGMHFRFPGTRDVVMMPGQRVLLVQDRHAFEERYGLGHPIIGQYRGKLDNGGEALILSDSRRSEILLKLEYRDESPWPRRADGRGASLKFVGQEAADLNDPSNWEASSQPGGDPGR